MNTKFTLVELPLIYKGLAHTIDFSNNEDLKKEATDALLTSISANLKILLDKKGTEIPANCTMDQLLDKAVEQHSGNIHSLCNVMHDLIVFQHNSDTFQAVVNFLSLLK